MQIKKCIYWYTFFIYFYLALPKLWMLKIKDLLHEYFGFKTNVNLNPRIVSPEDGKIEEISEWTTIDFITSFQLIILEFSISVKLKSETASSELVSISFILFPFTNVSHNFDCSAQSVVLANSVLSALVIAGSIWFANLRSNSNGIALASPKLSIGIIVSGEDVYPFLNITFNSAPVGATPAIRGSNGFDISILSTTSSKEIGVAPLTNVSVFLIAARALGSTWFPVAQLASESFCS